MSQSSQPFEPAADIGTPYTPSSLEGLRTRLAQARMQRGNCPPLDAIRGDHLPTIHAREGREERAAHVERCPVCHHQLRSWLDSWEGRAAIALAWSEVARHHTGVRLKAMWDKRPRRAPVPFPSHAEMQTGLVPPAPDQEIWSPPPAPPRRVKPSLPSRFRKAVPETLPPLLVLETGPPGIVPRSLLAAVSDRGGAIVTVENLEEVFRDRDFASVRALVLARARPLAEWPEAIRKARERAPKRSILAVVPMPSFGRSAISWLHDPAVIGAPVQEKDWEPALTRAGWPERS